MTSPALYSITPPAEAGVPEGFNLLELHSGFFRQLGAVYLRTREDGSAVIALRVAPHHLNIHGVAHGGMLTTLADSALGVNVSMALRRRGGQVTVSLTADFLSGARLGDWLEAHVVVTRQGRRLVYASCDLKVGERHVLRSSAVFALVERDFPADAGETPLHDG